MFTLFPNLYIFLILSILVPAHALLYCYKCTSAQSGCGDPIDVRLQHWHKCSGRRVLEDYCVKYIRKVADQHIVTRGCLSDLLLNTAYRLDMSQVRRQGYCMNSRAYQRYEMRTNKGRERLDVVMGLYSDRNSDYERFCFCNEFNGCNVGSLINAFKSWIYLKAIMSTVLVTSFHGYFC